MGLLPIQSSKNIFPLQTQYILEQEHCLAAFAEGMWAMDERQVNGKEEIMQK